MFSNRQRSHDIQGAQPHKSSSAPTGISPSQQNILWRQMAMNAPNRSIQLKSRSATDHQQSEREADRVADQVVARSPQVRPLISQAFRQPVPQRMCAECEEEGEVQLKARDDQQTDDIASGADIPTSGGHPLPESLRDYFEPRFERDFSQVRLHTDQLTAESASQLNARAYTSGRHIVFDRGEYQPQSDSGRRLLAHELTHTVQQGAVGDARGRHGGGITARSVDTTSIQRDRSARPRSLRVWGLPITRSMCGCKDRVREGITWANTAGATYAGCDTPANPTATDVEACFDAAHPTATTVATTSASGTVTLPPASSDPCDRIENKATYVHEYMHARHTDAIARGQGRTFFREWRKLRGDPDRLDKLRPRFPAEVAAFLRQWNNGHDWAQDEVNSYKWERRFLQSALRALNRIC